MLNEQEKEKAKNFAAAALAVRTLYHGNGVSVSYKKRTIRIRTGYFYKHRSLEEWRDKKIAELNSILSFKFTMISYDDCWNAWPKNSYYEIIFSVAEHNPHENNYEEAVAPEDRQLFRD